MLPPIWLLLTQISITFAQDLAKCYWLNGEIERMGIPCNASAALAGEPVPCCWAGSQCHDKGVCVDSEQGITYRLSCTSSTRGPGCQDLPDSRFANNSGYWIMTCGSPAARTACAMGSQDSCCEDPASKLFSFVPGKIRAVIDAKGTNLLGQADEKGVVHFSGNKPQTSPAGGSSPSSTSSDKLSCGPTQSSALDVKCNDSGQSVDDLRRTLLGVAVSLGVLLAAAIAAIIYLFGKCRAEKKKQLLPPPPETVQEDEKPPPWGPQLVQVPGTYELHAGQLDLYEASDSSRR